jgi:hypothetical protein
MADTYRVLLTFITLKADIILGIFMHRKAVFFLASLFLVVALVVPPVVLFLKTDNDLDNFIISQNPNGHVTSGNLTFLSPEELQENYTTTFIIVVAVEGVFVTLFVVTVYYGIRHTHPKH